jgi:hypothetical protein
MDRGLLGMQYGGQTQGPKKHQGDYAGNSLHGKGSEFRVQGSGFRNLKLNRYRCNFEREKMLGRELYSRPWLTQLSAWQFNCHANQVLLARQPSSAGTPTKFNCHANSIRREIRFWDKILQVYQ